MTTQADCLVSAAKAYADVCALSSPALPNIADRDAQIVALQSTNTALTTQLNSANATLTTLQAKIAQADADADASLAAAQKVAADLP